MHGLNVEFKCRVDSFAPLRGHCRRMGAKLAGVIEQTDTYFTIETGRLKLRGSTPGHAELIRYDRPDIATGRTSRYQRIPIEHPDEIRRVLGDCFGVRRVVVKRRELWLKDNVRVHLDDVAGMGLFLEFEVIATAECPEAICRMQLHELIARFELCESDAIGGSYGD